MILDPQLNETIKINQGNAAPGLPAHELASIASEAAKRNKDANVIFV
jgi:hypothetical protein